MTPKTAFRLGIAMVLAGAELIDLRPFTVLPVAILLLGVCLAIGGTIGMAAKIDS